MKTRRKVAKKCVSSAVKATPHRPIAPEPSDQWPPAPKTHRPGAPPGGAAGEGRPGEPPGRAAWKRPPERAAGKGRLEAPARKGRREGPPGEPPGTGSKNCRYHYVFRPKRRNSPQGRGPSVTGPAFRRLPKNDSAGELPSVPVSMRWSPCAGVSAPGSVRRPYSSGAAHRVPGTPPAPCTKAKWTARKRPESGSGPHDRYGRPPRWPKQCR